MNKIEIFQDQNNQTRIEVRFEGETFWLSLTQMAELFERDKSVISRHLKNIFDSEELSKISVVAKNATTAHDGKTYLVDYYNLDAILSVGYRVNSKRGTQFRQWATARLKEYLVNGFAVNKKRIDELGHVVQLVTDSVKQDNLQLQEAKGLLEILSSYTKSFVLLNQFDSRSVQSGKLSELITYEIQYDEAKAAINELKKQLLAKKQATELFGKEKDQSFKSSLLSIVQTFGEEYLYPTIEEQAAHLLYFVIKNHSFADGNKRIGAFLFVWFLEKNRHRYKSSGELKINDNGLTAVALLVAQSKPDEKEIIIQLIISLISESVT